MKVNWDEAPEWANWVAQDEDGEWWWFEDKPNFDDTFWAVADGKCELVEDSALDWKTTLEKRP